MDSEKLIERLSKYSEPVIAYKLDADFAASITDAISELRGTCDGCSVPATTAEMIRDLNDAPKLRAENEKLRADVVRFNDMLASYQNVLVPELRAELEQVKAGRDAAIEYLREIEWCAGCKHFGGLDGCKKWAMGQCTEKHDLYEFVGPQKED